MKQIVLCCVVFLFLGIGPSPTSAIDIEDIMGIKVNEGEFITFKYNEQTFTFRASNYFLPHLDLHIFNVNRLQQAAEVINNQVAVKAQSAYVDEKGNIVNHLTGIAVDEEQLMTRFLEFSYTDPENRYYELPIRYTAPRVTKQTLKEAMEKRISGFVTYYNPRNQNRAYNIKLAAKSLNHYVIMPGEIFSFNKAVGKRTEEKGYKRAPVIVRGELSEGIGGGICQVSSTLFNAADQAGLTIIKRYSHSKRVGYVPPGRDATVSWYGPDFTFRNDYDHPVLIKCYAGQGTHSVEIFSNKRLEAERRDVQDAPKELPPEETADDLL
jgi:vancomycin resistance protein YoaR